MAEIQCERRIEVGPEAGGGLAASFARLPKATVRRPLSAGYILSLLLIAPILLLLPLVYLGIIALAGYGTYYHAVEHITILQGRFIVGRIVLYAGPLVGGAAIVLFMLKPLFARSVHKESLFTLDRSQEPKFYEFVDRIALAVGAPQPGSIEIECIPNASASFRRGLIGMVRRDLVLNVGVPLIAGMNARQFAGVVAHEIGHFSQGMGMSLTHVVHVINGWFARMVYERDSWDERLDALGNAGENAVVWCTVAIGRLCVWLARRVLWALMMIAHAVSLHVQRQMEFDADACEAVIAGSDTFAQTQVLVEEIGAAFGHAAAQLEDFRAEGQLPDDLPAYVAATLQTMPAHVRQAINERRATERTRFFDTHPPARVRIERAKQAALPGVFHDTSPAASLFANYPLLCRWTTLGFYREYMEFADAAERLAPSAKMIERMRIDTAGSVAVSRFFKDIVHALHFTFDDRRIERALRSEGDGLARWREARRRFEDALAPAREALEKFDEATEKWRDAITAGALIGAKVRIDAATYGLKRANREEALQRERACFRRLEECSRRLKPFDEAAADRLGAALALLASDGSRDAASKTKLLRHAQRLRAALRAIDDAHRVVLDLTRTIVQLKGLLENADSQPDEDLIASRVNIALRDGQSGLQQLSRMLSSAEHPFAKGAAPMMIAQVTVEIPPQPHDVPNAIATACSRLFDLRIQCLGRLALIAEKGERTAAQSART